MLLRALLALAVAATGTAAAARDLGTQDWTPFDAAVRAQIAAGQVPGAVVVVGDADGIRWRGACGLRARLPQPEPMTVDTVFDLASLTKVIATTTAVLQLAERGRLDLEAPVARYWPGFARHGKAGITVAQLLAHRSGLRAGFGPGAGPADRAALVRRLEDETPQHAPGSGVLYSDLGFLALGELVQRRSGLALDAYARRNVFAPLGMRETTFRPDARLQPRIAPTEAVDGRWLRGTVHDPTARRLGGVAGHAGLFGTADDLARFARALLAPRPGRPLSPSSIAALRWPAAADAPSRGLGWELAAPFVAARDELPPAGAIGHTGYTGTGLWIDFVQRRFLIVLTNRVHPDGRGDARPLRRQLIALLSALEPPTSVEALARLDARFAALPPPAAEAPRAAVATGIDVLRGERYAPLVGRRVGLITNLSAIDAEGWRTLDRLRWAPGVALSTVFSPEHGLYGDAEGAVPSGTEPISGLPLASLYGTARRPDAAMLQGLDTLVFDLQDAGARFFTYVSTLGEAMEAAAGAGLRVVVLDRPNPLGGERVGGPVLDAGRESFTGWTRLPVMHGMTVGELARLFADEIGERRGVAVDLQVVPMRGWKRAMRFEQTGLDWVPPSPNLRTPTTALLYPGAAWVEGSNLSVGRGTEHPFERVGAPWIDGAALAQALEAERLPGLRFAPLEFVPDAAPYRGLRCGGIAIAITDRDAVDAPRLGLALVATLQRLWPQRFQLERTLGSVGSAQTLQDVRDGLAADAIAARWAPALDAFAARRAAALLYD